MLLVCLLWVLVSATPPRPKLADNFCAASLTTTITDGVVQDFAENLCQSSSLKKVIQSVNISVLLNVLDDYPAQMEYQYYPSTSHCEASKHDGEWFSLFGWLRVAKYGGQEQVNGEVCEKWFFSANNNGAVTNLTLDVGAKSGQPVRYLSQFEGTTIQFLFLKFDPTDPPAEYFAVPQYCNASSSELSPQEKSSLHLLLSHRRAMARISAVANNLLMASKSRAPMAIAPTPPVYPGDFYFTTITTILGDGSVVDAYQNLFQSETSKQSLAMSNVSYITDSLGDYNRYLEYDFQPAAQTCTVSAIDLRKNFFNILGWLPAATYQGQEVVLGEVTNRWFLDAKDPDGSAVKLTLNTGVTGDQLPVRLINTNGESGDKLVLYQMLIVAYYPKPPPASIFNIPTYCDKTAATTSTTGQGSLAPIPPTYPGDFSFGALTTVIDAESSNVTDFVEQVLQSATTKQALQIINMSVIVEVLDDYTKRNHYEWIPQAKNCAPRKMTDDENFFPYFGWLNSAEYQGQEQVNGVVCDKWTLDAKQPDGSDIKLTLDISTSNREPVRLLGQQKGNTLQMLFFGFSWEAPPITAFFAPLYCPRPSGGVNMGVLAQTLVDDHQLTTAISHRRQMFQQVAHTAAAARPVTVRADPSPPELPGDLSFSALLTVAENGTVLDTFEAYFQSERTQQTMNLYNVSQLFASLQDFHRKQKFEFNPQGQACTVTPLPADKKYSGMFDWLPVSKFDGQETVNGVGTNRFSLDVRGADGKETILTLNVAAKSSVPVRLTALPANGKPGGLGDFFQLIFFEFNATAPPASTFNIPSSCSKQKKLATDLSSSSERTLLGRIAAAVVRFRSVIVAAAELTSF